MPLCRICGNATGNREFIAREQAFETREEFPYLECAACGCLQIAEIPADLDRFYPADYYSLRSPRTSIDNPFQRWLQHQRTRYALGGCSPAGWLAARVRGVPPHLGWIKRMGLGTSARILDVGSGAGVLPLHMYRLGFQNVQGVDPFIANDLDYGALRIKRGTLADMRGQFELLMFHHSLEHMPDQDNALSEAARLLTTDGWLLVRIPLAGSAAWRTYGTDWVHLDAPRHLYLHTARSLELLAERQGFSLRQTVYDSTGEQFWGSEQNRQDIGLFGARSQRSHSKDVLFTPRQIEQYQQQARRLNGQSDGDQACFYFQRARPSALPL